MTMRRVKETNSFHQVVDNQHRWPDDPVVCATTPVHHHPPSNATQYEWALNSFTERELADLVADPEVDLIVHHGEEVTPPGFKRTYGHRELMSPHAGVAALGARMNRDLLEKVFEGEISNWSDMGGDDIPITVFSHGASLNHRCFEWQLRQNGLSISIPVKRMKDYVELAEAGYKDRGALIFGLRSEAQFAEWLIKAPLEPGIFVPQTISVFSRIGSATSAGLTRKFLVTVYARLREDRLSSIGFPDDQVSLH